MQYDSVLIFLDEIALSLSVGRKKTVPVVDRFLMENLNDNNTEKEWPKADNTTPSLIDPYNKNKYASTILITSRSSSYAVAVAASVAYTTKYLIH